MFDCFKLGQAQFKDSNFHCYSPVQFTPVMVFFGVTVHDCAVCRVGQLVDSSTSELLERIESFLDFDSLRGSQAEQYWHSILGAVFPELQELSLKNRLAALIQCGKRNMAASKFTFVEYFSGCGNLTKSFLAQEHLGAASSSAPAAPPAPSLHDLGAPKLHHSDCLCGLTLTAHRATRLQAK